jgi:hypothetical protein
MKKAMDLPAESRCSDCKWRLSRLVSPIDPDDFNVPEDTLLLEHVCILLEDDIGNIIVEECTRYEKDGGKKQQLFENQLFK